ncbi:MAG: hypothetical protein HOY76_47815 [Streptomyces sp.]|nr:hypothetical protein [Streptomyces sp.]NUS85976.1 hypothetical protein [Streptomyces sp.]
MNGWHGAHGWHGGQARLPVAIVGGLHTEARRAAVEEILHTVPGSIALHHDLSAAAGGAVQRTVRDARGLLAEGDAPLVNNFACCALREDLPCLADGNDLAEAGLAAAPTDQRTIADTFARQLAYPTVIAMAEGAADTQVRKVRVHGAAAPPADAWVSVTGTWHPTGELGTDGASPALDAATVARLPAPKDPCNDTVVTRR